VSGEHIINIFLVFFSSGPLTQDHLIELEAEELAKTYHDEKKGNVNSNKGRKKPTKEVTGTVVEEPGSLHTLPSTKKASPTLVKKTSVITDSTRHKKQNEYNKFDQNNEKVCANIKSLPSGNKKTPSVVIDSNSKKVGFLF
jgi:hypothetical protein